LNIENQDIQATNPDAVTAFKVIGLLGYQSLVFEPGAIAAFKVNQLIATF
jgi:hypothetical protein